MTKALARFAVIDSRRWIHFLPGLLPKLDNTDFAALPPVEQRMLQMFYVTLWGKTAESWEDEEVLDNLYSREYKGRSDKARELYDIAWKYLRPLWHFKIAVLYAQDFQNILDKMADNGLSQRMLEKERTLISKLYRTAIGWRVVDLHPKATQMIEAFDKANQLVNDEVLTTTKA